MKETLGKPGIPLPEDLTDAQKRDAKCQPFFEAKSDRLSDDYIAALAVPENNPYWRHCGWEIGHEPSILHALSYATRNVSDSVYSTVGQRGIDRKWLEHLTGSDARAWVRARAKETGLTPTMILKRAGASFEVYRELMRRWDHADAEQASRQGESNGEVG